MKRFKFDFQIVQTGSVTVESAEEARAREVFDSLHVAELQENVVKSDVQIHNVTEEKS